MAAVPETAAAPVLFTQHGALGIITLNRPQALNALNLDMIREIAPQLEAWAQDAAVHAVLIRGAGEKAFCAGGDVRAVYEDGLAMKRGDAGRGALTRDFFREEYALNAQIRYFPKPYIALLDGIAMGGGIGLSVHGTFRVVTERALLAMPETGIGLFPDVGGTYVLARAPGELGTFAALTGARLGAADSVLLGLATHAVASAKLEVLVSKLAESLLNSEIIAEHLRADILPLDAGPLAAQRENIDRCFAHDRVEDILSALAADGTEWAVKTLKTVEQMSPTSLKITLAALRRAKNLDFSAAQEMEYRLVQKCMSGHDFYEGIRALLVDKDKQPKWQPKKLQDVSESMINFYFM